MLSVLRGICLDGQASGDYIVCFADAHAARVPVAAAGFAFVRLKGIVLLLGFIIVRLVADVLLELLEA